ncbi:sensor histidine kinase [Agilicoccus flavus]|uniref:sensor histidine kinase n=1 Tax=Agilicoccus flavus TaxID=2775968 RepID=UPI001CF66A7D|nr:histidine kinase [Agilicoccus flavus]
MRRLIGWGETAHVFLGAALALPPTLLAWAFTLTATQMVPSVVNVFLVVALGLVAIVGIVAVACAPPVRSVEIAAARSLLGLDLPDPVAPGDLTPRLLGAAWCALVALIGGAVLFALLLFVPLGFGLLAFPLTGERPLLLPLRARPFDVGTGWAAAWLVVPGALSLAAAWGCLVGGGRAVRRLAPRFLGPTDADRAAVALRREREVAHANALARDLHDSVGHALTAMTIQATAARVALARDPEAALRAITAIEDTGRAAVGELDAMLGVLRRGADGLPVLTDPTGEDRPGGEDAPVASADEVEPRLPDLLAAARRDVGLQARVDLDLDGLDPRIRAELARITSEALANVARHGCAPARLHLAHREDGGVHLDVANALPVASTRAAPMRSGGRGLVGIRERALLLGGTAHAGTHGGEWLVTVDVPGGAP